MKKEWRECIPTNVHPDLRVMLLVGNGTLCVIDGATAKKNTITTQDPDIIKHDYSVFVNIRDIKQPIVRIHTAANETLTSDLVALFNAIIASK